jgi:hypothetical protein
MDGKYIITITLFFIICSCKNEVKTNDRNGLNTDSQRVFIAQNINSLIDSVESFDTSLFPRSKEFKDLKVEKITIGLLDSVFSEYNRFNSKNNQSKYFTFKLEKCDLVNFKSDYKIKIVKINNDDTKVLFVSFFNLNIVDNKASIEVKKKLVIGMIRHKYYFEKENNIWVFKEKELLGMG